MPSVPAYLFYPYLSEGPSLVFEAAELSDDTAAMLKGLEILAEHGSAAELEIWRDDQLIHRERRGGELSSPSAAGRSGSC